MYRPKDWANPHNVYELHPLHSQIEDARLHRAYEEGANAIVKAIIAEGVISQLSTGYIGRIFELKDNNEWGDSSDRALIRKMSESEGIAPIYLDKRIGYLVFLPATIEKLGGN